MSYTFNPQIESILIVDKENDMVGCVLIQAAKGTDHTRITNEIKPERWLTSPTDTMKAYKIPHEYRQEVIDYFNSL